MPPQLLADAHTQEGYEIMLVLGREVWSTSGYGRVWQKSEVSGKAH